MLISILRHGSLKVQFMSFSEIKVAFGMIASAPSPVVIVLERMPIFFTMPETPPTSMVSPG